MAKRERREGEGGGGGGGGGGANIGIPRAENIDVVISRKAEN